MAARRRKGRKPPRRTAKKPARRAGRKRAPAKRKPTGARGRPAAKRPRAAARKRTTAKRAAHTPRRAPAARTPARERLAAGVPVEVGVVAHWFPRASAAVVVLSRPIHLGDTIHVRGRSTDFVQQVASLALDGRAVSEGAAAQHVGVRLDARARPGDRVFRISW